MRLTITFIVATVFVVFSGVSAIPLMFDVWSYDLDGINPDIHLGTIDAFSGDIDAAANYNYGGPGPYSGDPIHGPTPTAYQSFVWLYYDNINQSLSFNLIHNVYNGGSAVQNTVKWDLWFKDMDVSVLLQDDNPEPIRGFEHQGGDYWWADFEYTLNTDGGVLGIDPYNYCDWSIEFVPFVELGDIVSVNAASYSNPDVNLWSVGMGDKQGYRITPTCVPEPGTLILLCSGLLLCAVIFVRRL